MHQHMQLFSPAHLMCALFITQSTCNSKLNFPLTSPKYIILQHQLHFLVINYHRGGDQCCHFPQKDMHKILGTNLKSQPQTSSWISLLRSDDRIISKFNGVMSTVMFWQLSVCKTNRGEKTQL